MTKISKLNLVKNLMPNRSIIFRRSLVFFLVFRISQRVTLLWMLSMLALRMFQIVTVQQPGSKGYVYSPIYPSQLRNDQHYRPNLLAQIVLMPVKKVNDLP